MKRGDRGDIVMAGGGGGSALCLYKFYPAPDCSVRFSCSSFSVGAASPSPASCTRKLVTKAGSRPARRWCGATPPEPLVSAEPVLVGYMDLGAGLAPQASEVQCMIVAGYEGLLPPGLPGGQVPVLGVLRAAQPGGGGGGGLQVRPGQHRHKAAAAQEGKEETEEDDIEKT